MNTNTKGSSGTAIDPVCGMAVNPNGTDVVFTFKGKPYYFCAESCRRSFAADPEKFLNPGPKKRKGLWGRYLDRLQKSTDGKCIKCH